MKVMREQCLGNSARYPCKFAIKGDDVYNIDTFAEKRTFRLFPKNTTFS